MYLPYGHRPIQCNKPLVIVYVSIYCQAEHYNRCVSGESSLTAWNYLHDN